MERTNKKFILPNSALFTVKVPTAFNPLVENAFWEIRTYLRKTFGNDSIEFSYNVKRR